MHERTGSESSVEELEVTVLSLLDLYFEAQLREIAQAEEELEAISRRKQEIKAGTVDAAVEDSGVSELGEQISELQEEVRGLAEAEKASQVKKEAAKERLRRAELDLEGDTALSSDEVAAIALSTVEEIDAFKSRLDRRFAEGRTSALGSAI